MKKIIALPICLTVAISTASCQPKPSEVATTEVATTEVVTTEMATTEVAATTLELPPPQESVVTIEAQEAKFNYKIAENTSGKQLKIAVVYVDNNPFWMDVIQGSEDVKKVMEAKYNCTVDLITVEDFNAKAFSEAIENCVVKGYDSIVTLGVSDATLPAINKAVDSGIPVYTFNSDTGKGSKRTAFYGQDSYAAGEIAGDTLAKLMGEEGKVAIITGVYSDNVQELRRTGGLTGFKKYPKIQVVGEAEAHDSDDEAYAKTKEFLQANPDLKGIYCTAEGQMGVVKALKELGLTEQVNVVCFGYTKEIIDSLYDKSIKATISQDLYAQGVDPVIFAYNERITGKDEHTGNVFTKIDVITPENVAQFFPR